MTQPILAVCLYQGHVGAGLFSPAFSSLFSLQEDGASAPAYSLASKWAPAPEESCALFPQPDFTPVISSFCYNQN